MFDRSLVYPVLLAIDPSVNNVGWACYNFGGGSDQYDIIGKGWSFGLVHPKGTNIQYKWRDCYTQLKDRLGSRKPTHLAIEYPMYFESVKGKIAAQEGYTIDLASMLGFLAGRFEIKAEYITLWNPMQWKGSVPKHVTEKKFIRVFGEPAKRLARELSNDVIDAIMIAEFWLSLYNREKFSWQRKQQNVVYKS